MKFKVLNLKQQNESLSSVIELLDESELPEGDVLIEVHYSSLNYKDAAALGNRGIIRKFPMVPGIDLAGVVIESQVPAYKAGDSVLLTGWGIGETHWGGYSQINRVDSKWLVPLPKGLSLKQAMSLGTAGLTSMLSVMALEENEITPNSGEILVTGASGGVGSLAIPLLVKKGYKVTALTGRLDNSEYLKELGATQILERSSFLIQKRPGRFTIESEAFAGVIDTVGGDVLAAALARTKYAGCVTACGLVGGTDINTSVFPFILRGIHLVGIDSVKCPSAKRERAWKQIATEFPLPILDKITKEIQLQEVPKYAEEMLAGSGLGRKVVALRGI